MLTTEQFLVSTIFFENININFFNLCSDPFSMITKKVNQIRSIAVCVVARPVFFICCALTAHIAMLFNIFS